MKELFLIQMRECVALIEAEVAAANRELQCLGQWQTDHQKAISDLVDQRTFLEDQWRSL